MLRNAKPELAAIKDLLHKTFAIVKMVCINQKKKKKKRIRR